MSLSNEEKIGVVDQHIKSLSYILYGAQLDLIEANAATNPDLVTISAINTKISDLNSKLEALNTELSSLS